MQEIFNEGRVVGLSAYETYVRHHMEEFGDDPNNLPASEREWLASSISLGTSALLEMSPDGPYTLTKTFDGGDGTEGKYWGVEIKMPTECRLCAANSIIASVFIGEGELDTNNKPFCKSVLDYGFLSSKTGESNYTTMTMNPSQAKYYDKQIKEYMKLIDGVVVHPCTDYNNYIPDLHDSSKIRLLFRSKIETKFYLLLSGFSDCSVINGTSIHMEGSLNTDKPNTGDFLGPVVFPWSSKILITTPSSAISRLFTDKFARILAEVKNTSVKYSGVSGGISPYKVSQDAIIDYNHSHMIDFYMGSSSLANKMSRIQEYVKQYSPIGDGINQLAVISKDGGSYDLPSIYGASVTSEGSEYLYPIDCAAPGTIKAYPETVSSTELIQFPENRPGSYPVIMKEDGTIYRVVIENGIVVTVPVADMTVKSFTPTKSGKYLVLKIGRERDASGNWITKQTASPVIPDNQAIVYNDSTDNINGDYVSSATISGASYMGCDSIDTPVNFISMRTWAYAVTQNKRLDLLGDALKLFRNTLEKVSNTELKVHIKINFDQPMQFNYDATFQQDIIVKEDATIGNHLILTQHKTRADGCDSGAASSGHPTEAHIDLNSGVTGRPKNNKFAIGVGSDGAGYITMTNGLRLYISNTEPLDSDIPEGSIGIGW